MLGLYPRSTSASALLVIAPQAARVFQALSDRAKNRGYVPSVTYAQYRKHLMHVAFYGSLRDLKACADLLVRKSADETLRDLELPAAKAPRGQYADCSFSHRTSRLL